MLRYLVEDGEAKGIVLGILEPDGSTRVVSYGRTDEAGTPLRPQSSFEIGSITKTFTATLLADMVARGNVSLSDPVSKYLPPEVRMPTFSDREITLVDLATHTSGLSDPVMQAALSSRGVEDALAVPVEELFAMLSGYELSREPGTVVEYSNAGMGLLGLALGRATGSSLPALVQERILEPLGMTETAYDLEEVPVESQVQGFYGERAVPPVVNSSALDGAGGLRSNMEDMLRFLAANVGAADTDLGRAMRDAQGARHPTGAGGRSVGLAWSTVVLGGRELIEHSGDTDGFTTQIAFDPEREVGVVLLTNSGPVG